MAAMKMGVQTGGIGVISYMQYNIFGLDQFHDTMG